jgi:hypothetical protein
MFDLTVELKPDDVFHGSGIGEGDAANHDTGRLIGFLSRCWFRKPALATTSLYVAAVSVA